MKRKWRCKQTQTTRAMAAEIANHFKSLWTRHAENDDITGVLFDIIDKYQFVTSSNIISFDKLKLKTIVSPTNNNGKTFLENIVRLSIWLHHFKLQDSDLCRQVANAMDVVFLTIAPRYPFSQSFLPSFSECIEMLLDSETCNMWIWNVDHVPLECPIYELMVCIWRHQSHPLEAYRMLSEEMSIWCWLPICIFAIYKEFHIHVSSHHVTVRLDALAFAFKNLAEAKP
jgi:hypothetical protein